MFWYAQHDGWDLDTQQYVEAWYHTMQLRLSAVEPNVTIVPDRREGRWQIQLSCADRPGLLSAIASVLLQHGLNLIDARVATLGLRAEDTFVMSGQGLGDAGEREAIAVELTQIAAS